MKSNVESRVKNYEQELEKFAARWHQLKPGDDAMDGDQAKCMEAVKSIKERKQEFEELEKTREALVYVDISHAHCLLIFCITLHAVEMYNILLFYN